MLTLGALPARGETPEPAQPFAACLDAIAAGIPAGEVPPALLAEHLRPLTPDPDVLAATRTQAEFVKPLWAYLDSAITEARIIEGRRKLEAWKAVLDGIEPRYGVDRHVLVAFWGIESNYGAILDVPSVLRPVLRSLATLACGDPGRAAYWRTELVAALRLLAEGEARADTLTGSWAGAMGHTQFMPTVARAHAVDFDGDGRRDIWTSVPDALASTANYLEAMGWRTGEAWGTEAILPEGFDYALADETTERSLAAWQALGVRPVQPGEDTARATLLVPAGARGPAFLIRPNFRVILRYNTALAYGLAVAHLSDRLRGAPVFTRDWPRGDRPLTVEEVRDLQIRLTGRGHDAGSADGKVGPKTRAAIRAYQAAGGGVPDGYADAAVLERIRSAP